MTFQAIAFDAYGTLFDVYSIGALAEKLFPNKGEALATLWRDKQIEYTRLRTMCSMYKPLWEVTQDALIFSCNKLGLHLDFDSQNALMGQYAKLQAFPENLEVGNPPMLESAVNAAGMQGIFSHLLSVDSVKKYKTAPEAYQLGPDMFSLPAKKILFVSSNAWDVCGATWFGYTTFWVNRAGAPIEELGVKPDAEGKTLKDLLAYVKKSIADSNSSTH